MLRIYFISDIFLFQRDYAYLSREDNPDEEPKCVARALLPAEITENSRLLYEIMEYSLV